jgi:hypothetical protein
LTSSPHTGVHPQTPNDRDYEKHPFRDKNFTYLLFFAGDTDSLLVDALLTIGPVAHPAFMDGRFPGIILATGCTSELFFWREIRWHISTPFSIKSKTLSTLEGISFRSLVNTESKAGAFEQ